MTYHIQYSKLFRRDLDKVWAEVFVASQNRTTTKKYINELIDKIEKYKDYPKLATPLYYEDDWTGFYFVTFKAYMIFYHIENNTIFMDRVLYAQSDYMQKLNINFSLPESE